MEFDVSQTTEIWGSNTFQAKLTEKVGFRFNIQKISFSEIKTQMIQNAKYAEMFQSEPHSMIIMTATCAIMTPV